MPTTRWTADKIRQLRDALGDSVDSFGERFGRSGRTVEDWEQGRRRPDAMVLIEMERIAKQRKLADL